MGWQERFRALGEQLTSGQITTDEYRERSASILAEAEHEADQEAAKVRIPRSAAWEAPSGEMTQIVGTRDETTIVSDPKN